MIRLHGPSASKHFLYSRTALKLAQHQTAIHIGYYYLKPENSNQNQTQFRIEHF